MSAPLYRDALARAEAQYHITQVANQEAAKTRDDLLAYEQTLDVAQALIQRVARDTQEQIRYNLENIVNLALDTVFPDMYEFRLIFETKASQTVARIVVMENGVELDVLDSTGGGLADILSFSLRMALLVISRNMKCLILDEPFRFVSENLRPKVYEIMKRLSTDMGIAVLMVTHDLMAIEVADYVYRVKKEGGVSYATEE